MHLTLLTPWALLFATASVLTALAFHAAKRRADRVGEVLGEVSRRTGEASSLISLVAIPVLLAIAASQPAIEQTTTRNAISNAEIYAVLDTSRSMQASTGAHSATRLQRAIDEVGRISDALPNFRFGIASLTDRLLPYLFPTSDRRLLAATLASSVGIDTPPPTFVYGRATSLSGLASLATAGYYTADQRVAIVLTDGETRPVSSRLATTLKRAKIHLIFVHIWKPTERIYLAGGTSYPGYRPDPTSAQTLNRLAVLTNGTVVSDGNPQQVVQAVNAKIRSQGRTRFVRIEDRSRVSLGKWIILSVVIPMTLLVWPTAKYMVSGVLWRIGTLRSAKRLTCSNIEL
jgi:hypothetical protein